MPGRLIQIDVVSQDTDCFKWLTTICTIQTYNRTHPSPTTARTWLQPHAPDTYNSTLLMLKVYYGFQNTPLANYIEKGPKTMSLQPHQHSNLSIDVHVASVLHDELLQDAPLKRKKNSTREQRNIWLGRFSPSHESSQITCTCRKLLQPANRRSAKHPPNRLCSGTGLHQIHPTVESHLHD